LCCCYLQRYWKPFSLKARHVLTEKEWNGTTVEDIWFLLKLFLQISLQKNDIFSRCCASIWAMTNWAAGTSIDNIVHKYLL
jgi:hypothetical protein